MDTGGKMRVCRTLEFLGQIVIVEIATSASKTWCDFWTLSVEMINLAEMSEHDQPGLPITFRLRKLRHGVRKELWNSFPISTIQPESTATHMRSSAVAHPSERCISASRQRQNACANIDSRNSFNRDPQRSTADRQTARR